MYCSLRREIAKPVLHPVEINPNVADAHNNLASLYMRLGENDKALTYIKNAIKINPKFSLAYNNLGMLNNIVGKFDDELTRIKSEILEMGELVGNQIKEAMDALLSFNTEGVDALVKTDRTINGMNKKINRHAEQLIAMRQPMALDLREALLATSIASELERLGDYAKSTAKKVRKLSENSSGEAALALLGNMGEIVMDMLRNVLKAYEKNDIEAAAEIRIKDVEVDEINKKILATIIKSIHENPEDTETLIHLVLLSRNFERAGDHIVNISRQIHQIVTGEDLKASN